MEFKKTQLDNGLTIVAEVNPSAASMATGFFVRTGSRDETPEISGVSHFLEHMMFKGTDRRTPMDVNREFDEIGANYNAFTAEENTVYYGAVLPEFQNRLLDLLGDMLRPALRQEDFDMEKNVIQEEIALYLDRPQFRVYERIMQEHFAGHPLGNSILGTTESIGALKRDQMQEYFDRRYSPGNVSLVGVGNLDWDAFVGKATEMCSHWKPFGVSRETPSCSGSQATEIILDEKVAREHVAFATPGPSAQDERRFAAELAAAIIGDDTGSRFYYALIEPALADEALLMFDPMDGAGAFIGFVSADPSRGAQAIKIARKELETFQNEGPTEAELKAAKNKIASSATLKGELPMGRLTAVGFDWVYRNEYKPLDDQIDALLAVSAEEVREVVRSFDITSTTLVGLGPLKSL